MSIRFFSSIGISFSLLIFKVTKEDYNADDDSVSLRKYKDPVASDDYCVDRDNNSTELVVTCDQCAEGKICIHKCCPFDKKYNFIDSTDIPPGLPPNNFSSMLELPLDESCLSSDIQMPNIPFTDSSNHKTLDWKEGTNYIIVGPTEQDPFGVDGIIFTCPIKENPWYHPETDDAYLDKFGRVNGIIDDETKEEDKRYVRGTYCVFENVGRVGINICILENEIDPNDCEITRRYTFNTAFIISIIFIILAILAHFIEAQLNATMFGKISVVYLFNLLGSFITIMVDRMNKFERETTPCVMVAYMLQYFGLSIFFSINTLAYILFRTVRVMADGALNYKFFEALENFFDPKKKNFLLKGIAYIQGFPLIISLITYVIDNDRKRRENEGEKGLVSFPNAGVVFCYMSFQNPGRNINYFLTPEFIYVQSFQLFIILVNFVLFSVTVKSYFSFQVTPENVKRIDQHKKNFKIVVQLFFTMLCFWIFEIITSAISTDYGINETCGVRFVLDAPNAFYGLLAFLMLVCMKPTVVKALKDNILSTFIGTSVTTNTTRVSTIKATKSNISITA